MAQKTYKLIAKAHRDEYNVRDFNQVPALQDYYNARLLGWRQIDNLGY